jgi:hypothetical protein
MDTATLLVGEDDILIPQNDLLVSCEAFRENPALANAAYRVTSRVSPRIARLYAEILDIPHDAWNEFALLANELGGPRISRSDIERRNPKHVFSVLLVVFLGVFCAWSHVSLAGRLERGLASPSSDKVAGIKRALLALSDRTDRLAMEVSSAGEKCGRLEAATMSLRMSVSSSKDKISELETSLQASNNRTARLARNWLSSDRKINDLDGQIRELSNQIEEWRKEFPLRLARLEKMMRDLRRERSSWYQRIAELWAGNEPLF